MRQISVITKEFDTAVQKTRALPWKHNWDEDTQPGYRTSAGYQDLAHKLRIEMLERVKDLLTLAPYAVLKDDRDPPDYQFYKHDEIDALITEIRANPSDMRFLKSADSIAKKLRTTDVNQDPTEIKDYLRFQIISNNVADIAAIRGELLNTRGTLTSYKDQLRRPCEEGGHRAFKFHMELGTGADRMVIEGQVGHIGLEELDVTKHLRGAERSIQDAFNTVADEVDPSIRPVVLHGMGEASKVMQKVRLAVNHHVAHNLGMDVFLDEGINSQNEITNALSALDEADPHTRLFLGKSRSLRVATELLGRRELV